MSNKIDILAFGAHPDDVEAACGGILSKQHLLGYKTGIIDLTRGELGSRGSIKERDMESQAAKQILNLQIRENLNIKDGFIFVNEENLFKIITVIRKYRPEIVLLNPIKDRHPDHEKAGELVRQATFLSGLINIETKDNGIKQGPWRPKTLFQYMLSRLHIPSFVIPLTDEHMRLKLRALQCYKTQFCIQDEDLVALKSPNTDIYQYSKEDLKPLFASFILARAREFAQPLERLQEYKYAEGLLSCRITGTDNLFNLL